MDKILRGAIPGDIPVEQAAKIQTIVNSRTAKSLGIEVPTSLLLRTDEVVEIQVLVAMHESDCGRYCCKSLFAA
jgi:hypothetical protein